MKFVSKISKDQLLYLTGLTDVKVVYSIDNLIITNKYSMIKMEAELDDLNNYHL